MEGIENFIGYCNDYLAQQWEEINKRSESGQSGPEDFLGEEFKEIKAGIVACLSSVTKSYHYVLPTQLLSKAVEPTRDCRSLQAAYNKPGAFDARSIAHKVIVPFDKRNYNVLGGSAEPYVNNPLRCVSVTADNEARQKNKEDWRRLVNLLEIVEQKDDPDFTRAIFNQVLLEIYNLLAHVRVVYPVPGRISLDKTMSAVTTFISKGSGGDREEVLTTALFREIAERFGLFDEVRRGKVNASDSTSGMAADIECCSYGQIVLMVEVKDKILTMTELEAKLESARAGKIKELLFITEKGIEENKKSIFTQRINSEFSSGQNVYILKLSEFFNGLLVLLGEEGRVGFISRVGPELDSGNSSILHRKAWANLLKEL